MKPMRYWSLVAAFMLAILSEAKNLPQVD